MFWLCQTFTCNYKKIHIWNGRKKRVKSGSPWRQNDRTHFWQPAGGQILEYNSELTGLISGGQNWYERVLHSSRAEKQDFQILLVALVYESKLEWVFPLILAALMALILSLRKVTGCHKVFWEYKVLSCKSTHVYRLLN